ncbi:MAG: tRNA 2-thiouridine(34) synthase MnmA [Deltaproteobacteria bacterium]|nr:tRNA 2-thiouridine(34) synthase MnmA [Deltaproteobacteria bacterium]
MKIAVALSGGIDSLMSLILVRESGAHTLAVHARFLDARDTEPRHALEDLCAAMGMELHVLDLRQEFERLVVAPFIAAYQGGSTPNPCATCNPAIKFGLLLDRALKLGADKLATGHYARLRDTQTGPALFRGLDPVKDQSYFLSRVPRERLTHVLFPLGEWTKADARQALAQRGLVPPEKEESQEICFIPTNYHDFLRARHVRLSGPGPITLADGTVLGHHQGLWRHTLGQRKGLGVAYSEPLYVIAKDAPRNRLVVGVKSQTMALGCRTAAPNLLQPPSDWPETVLAQTIYRQRPAPARIRVTRNDMHITFHEPRPLPAPGQIAAVYDEAGRVLAGAVIEETFHAT